MSHSGYPGARDQAFQYVDAQPDQLVETARQLSRWPHRIAQARQDLGFEQLSPSLKPLCPQIAADGQVENVKNRPLLSRNRSLEALKEWLSSFIQRHDVAMDDGLMRGALALPQCRDIERRNRFHCTTTSARDHSLLSCGNHPA
jgi:hypothetical protein